MNTRNSRITLIFGLALLVAACSSSVFKADVTRFHGQSVENYLGQSVIIRPIEGMTGNLEFSSYAAMVGQKLGELGFTPAGAETPDIVAQLDYHITPIATASSSGASMSIGAGSFGRRSGVGGGVSFPVGESKQKTAYSRRLELVLIDQASGTRIWEGRAMSEGTQADPQIIIPLLAEALLSEFPGLSGQTVTVKINPEQ